MPKKINKYVFFHMVLLVIATFGMNTIKSRFYIDESLSHPQFTDYTHFEDQMNRIEAAGKTGFFYGFFMMDLVWSFLLLSFFVQLMWRMNKATSLSLNQLFNIGSGLALTAWVMDAIEGLCYAWPMFPELLGSILKAKLLAYGLTIFTFLICTIQYFQIQKSANTK